jgi:hypothetical protein
MQGEFHLEEYKALRGELLSRLQVIHDIQRGIAIGAVAIYAWVATQTRGDELPLLPLLAAWLPVILAVAGNRELRANSGRIHELGWYLARLEERLGNAGLGWEHKLGSPAGDGGLAGRFDNIPSHHRKMRRLFIVFTVITSALVSLVLVLSSSWLRLLVRSPGLYGIGPGHS